ncbi:unnamed protein product [Peronospora belbahrii]|uniref:Major facilitator superfamily (MFS) profile domain-containing protein n=1 Tax=Peronospora belbahrii TaxID=622444 RepID=A0AAU9L7G4_9STRA|nr:unnamed protein product [Peronospora belbahrii]
MAEAGDLLVHVRQRLDALSYTNHSQYLLSLLQSSSFVPSVSTSRVSFPPRCQSPAVHITSTNRSHPSWLRYMGLTAFYMRLVLLLGMGWFLAMISIFTFLYALPVVQDDNKETNIVRTSTAQAIVLLGLYFLGGAIGSFGFGLCADYFGRKPVLLIALSLWVVISSLNAGAWNYTSFVILRLISGMCISGQLALLATLSLEYTPTRTRGKITILTISMAGLGVFCGIGYGQLSIVHLGTKGLGWRLTYGVLSAIVLSFVAMLSMILEESPKYLASVGRTKEAFVIVEKMETAHGINRRARVTVPTSLYEPPSRRPRVRYERYLNRNSESEMELEMGGGHLRPGAAKARSQSQRASRRRLQGRRQFRVALCTPNAGNQETRSDALTPSPNATFCGALTRRVVTLFSGALAVRTVVIWFYWFAQLTVVGAAIVTVFVMAGTSMKINHIGTTFPIGDQLYWSAMAFLGLLLAAMMVENKSIGRRGTLALFVFCGGVVMVVSALLLEEDGGWIGLCLALGAMVLTTGGTLGALISFSGEQFPLLTRALGLSCALAWGHLGMFTGLYLVLHSVMDGEAWSWYDERVMLAVCGGVSIVLLPLILLMGPETRGRDIDASWFENSEALHALAGGVLSVTPDGRSEQSTLRCRGPGNDSSNRGNKDVEKRGEISGDNDEKLPYSPIGPGSINGMAMVSSAIYAPAFAAPTAHALADRESSLRSSSPSSNLWQAHSVHHLGCKTSSAAQAVTSMSDKKQVACCSSNGKLRVPNSGDSRQMKGRSLNIEGQRDTRLPVDDLDQLDSMVVEHEYRHPRRETVAEPVLLEWRHSFSSSRSGSEQDLSSSKVDIQEHGPFEDKAASVSSTELGRYTIDLDMFDTFTYISTPVLGGDNYSDHEHRKLSNLSCVGSS